MSGKQIKCNAWFLLFLFITPAVLFGQKKKKLYYNSGTLYSEVVQNSSLAHDTIISGKIAGTDAAVRIDRTVKKYSIVFKNDEHPSNGMVFTFVRFAFPENTQPNEKIYLMEFMNQYYFLTDNIDNPLINELTIRAEKLLPDSTFQQYKIKGLKEVK